MPYLYEQSKENYTCFDHFKEMAIKTINEIYGRVKPLDVFDFSEKKDVYRCVAYYDHENIPGELKEGELTDDGEVDKARAAEEENKRKAEEELVATRARLVNVLEQGGDLSEEDKVIARNLELIDDEGKYTLDQVLNATDEAIVLAEEHGVDLKLVTGTGKDGNIKKGDVANFIKAREAAEKSNHAPEQENANDQTGEQQSGE